MCYIANLTEAESTKTRIHCGTKYSLLTLRADLNVS